MTGCEETGMAGFREVAESGRWPSNYSVRWKNHLEVLKIGPEGKTVKYEILWSPIYACPVVYMTCYTDSEPVTLLDEFIAFMKDLDVVITPDVAITQGEHPLTGLPVFFLHPCKTRETVDLLMRDEEFKGKSEAEVWLQSYGRVVGLNREDST